MYTPKAKKLRRCKGTTRAGKPCKAWAVWDDDPQLCNVHAGRHHTGIIMPKVPSWIGAGPIRRHPGPTCTCKAYGWPHRPAGGLCHWPDPPLM